MTTSAPGIRRRSLLSAGIGTGIAGLLVACGSVSAQTSADGRTVRTVEAPDPDVPVRARALAATRALAARYDAAIAAFPAAAGQLRPLRQQLTAQESAFGGTAASASASPSTSASATPPSTPATNRSAAVAALDAAERATAQARLKDLATASPALARQLASAAADGAQHSMLLRGSVPAGPAAAPVTRSALPTAALAALQAALAAEDAAVYAYGVIGAQLGGNRRTHATSSYQAHRDRRDALQQRIGATGATPAAAAPAYRLPSPVTDAASAVRLAGSVEDRICGVYANAVQATSGPLRLTMAAALRQAALDTLAWRGTGSAFPGLAHG
ncbi:MULTISPECIES: ferritin-like domain-containing protein [Streptacidiphilus]|uniref:Ferritin-like domain-containing protein n=1 Tax=Streptacidiphilus cavernicola TaxID=3342716 RepID=A0ABV6V0U4_9ACTN|nr:ferritin-like domain-containing protein [Streptacidiphilus jeojiense]